MNIILSESQYVHIVVSECYKVNQLNESKIDLLKFGQLLYRGCKTIEDFVRRNKKAVAMGVSIAIISTVMTLCFNGSEQEKDEIIEKTEEVIHDKYSMLDKTYATDFKVSPNGIKHIKRYEKCVLEPYYATEYEESKNIKTIGWGHKIIATDPDWLKNAKKITQKQADELFNNDIKIYENEVRNLFTTELRGEMKNPNQYPQGTMDVCVSMMYNCGMGNFKASPFFQTLKNCKIDPETKRIKQNDFYYTCSKIRKSCITQNGEVVKGLEKRREIECLMAQH